MRARKRAYLRRFVIVKLSHSVSIVIGKCYNFKTC